MLKYTKRWINTQTQTTTSPLYFLAHFDGLFSAVSALLASSWSSSSRHSAALAWPSRPSILARWIQSRTTFCAAALSSMFIHVRMRRNVNTLNPPISGYKKKQKSVSRVALSYVRNIFSWLGERE